MSSRSGGGPAPINAGGRCPRHPSIQLARRRRDGRWHRFLAQCPLCSADADASQWSGSAAASPRSNRTHPSKKWRTHHEEQRKRRNSLPSKPPSSFKEVKEDEPSPSSDKDVNESPNSIHVTGAEKGKAKVDPNDALLLRQTELRKRVKAGPFPPLPFSSVAEAEAMGVVCTVPPLPFAAAPSPIVKRSRSVDSELDSPKGPSPPLSPLANSPPRRGPPRRAYSETIPTTNDEDSTLDLRRERKMPRTSSLETLIQSRKEKIRELKLRRLVPLSQRFPLKDGTWETAASQTRVYAVATTTKDNAGSTSAKAKGAAGGHKADQQQADSDISERSGCSLHSMSTEHIGNLKADLDRARGASSFHSVSTEQIGNLTADIERVMSSENENNFSFLSDASHHMGTPMCSFHPPSTKPPTDPASGKKKNVLHVINVPSPVVQHTLRTGRLNASTLEISYDSFVEHGGRKGGRILRRIDSDDITEVTQNTGQGRRFDDKLRNSDSSESIDALDIDMSSRESQDDLNIASRDIWREGTGDGDIESGSNHLNAAKLHAWIYGGGVGEALQPGGNENVDKELARKTAGIVKECYKQLQDMRSGTDLGQQGGRPGTPAYSSKGALGNLNHQMNSLSVSEAGDKRPYYRKGLEQVSVEDVTDDEEEAPSSPSNNHSGHQSVWSDHEHGVEPPGHRSITASKQSNYDLHLDPPVSDPPDLTHLGVDEQWGIRFQNIGAEEKKRMKVSRIQKEAGNASDSSASSNNSGSSSSSESNGPQCFERKRGDGNPNRVQRCSSVPDDPPEARRRDSQRSAHTVPQQHRHSPRTRASASVEERANGNIKPSNSGQASERREYRKQISDSSEEGEKIFNKCDDKGRCIHHPHVQLRRKRRIGGRLKGKWKTIMMNCTECCYDEVQRLRLKNVRAKEQLHSTPKSAAKPPPPADKCDTSATASVTSASGSSAQSSADHRHHAPIGILRKKPKYGGNDSSITFSSNESEETTTFSYLSSLSASSSSAGLSSAYSASTADTSSTDSLERLKSPTGILRNSIASKRSPSPASSKSNSSKGSGRVVFAGRDVIINPVQFDTRGVEVGPRAA